MWRLRAGGSGISLRQWALGATRHMSASKGHWKGEVHACSQDLCMGMVMMHSALLGVRFAGHNLKPLKVKAHGKKRLWALGVSSA